MSYLQVGIIAGATRATKLNLRQVRDAPELEFRRGRYIKSIHETSGIKENRSWLSQTGSEDIPEEAGATIWLLYTDIGSQSDNDRWKVLIAMSYLIVRGSQRIYSISHFTAPDYGVGVGACDLLITEILM